MAQIDTLKRMLGISDTSQDRLLELLLDDVRSDLLAWTNRTRLPPALYPTARQLTVIRYNMAGVEGQKAHAEGAVSRTFEELPESIRNTIASCRRLKVLSYATPSS